MRVLFIGGTGNISLDASREFVARGHELWHLNRGSRPELAPPGVRSLRADIRDEVSVRAALGSLEFDAAVDFIAYGPEDVARSLRLLRGRVGHYLFLSSATVYEKPPRSLPITEATPRGNPYSAYARAKLACEAALERARLEEGWPVTIIRPSHTYGAGWLPTTFGSADFTVAARMLAGQEVVVPGDGQARWTLTHARDFARGLAGLAGNPAAIGGTVQLMGEEAPTWDEIHRAIGEALGVEPRLVHVPVEIVLLAEPALEDKLLGDKAWSSVFDCAKLRRLVPDFSAEVGYREGIRESAAWLLGDPARQRRDPRVGETMERILAAWRRALDAAAAR